jgi:hypothetical protein
MIIKTYSYPPDLPAEKRTLATATVEITTLADAPINPELAAAKALAAKLAAGTATAADKDGVLKYIAKAQGIL